MCFRKVRGWVNAWTAAPFNYPSFPPPTQGNEDVFCIVLERILPSVLGVAEGRRLGLRRLPLPPDPQGPPDDEAGGRVAVEGLREVGLASREELGEVDGVGV